ncbi:MAG: YebC/PmpR family DNA-binding transcriptional regulator, partial [Spirochaetaceae bacterium]|nr:YebC/PmpR family DNA-binding transcriptional regulator [Spirochaetaceae bacterium]
DAGAEDISASDGVIEVSADPADFEAVAKALEAANFATTSAEISMIPEAPVSLDKDATGKLLRLVERLEANDDVQNVYHNVDIPDDYEE